MNVLFMVAAVLLVLIGLAHSVLGERLLLKPLFAWDQGRYFRKRRLAKDILRFAWHLTTIAWWGMAVVVIDLAMGKGGSNLSLWALAMTSVLTGLLILFFSKGRHLAWIVFLAIAGCLWAGAW